MKVYMKNGGQGAGLPSTTGNPSGGGRDNNPPSKSTNKKVITMSKNTKPRPQYPKNKPSMQPFEKSGKGRSNKQTSK